jgi:3-deoxy-D-manno-octulosonic-acid transferase
MARFIYTLVVIALLPWALIHLVWRARRQPDYLQHWGERFGLFSAAPPTPTIWIHAVSVGETRAAQPLVAALKADYPDHRILFTHMTPTGRATSEEIFGGSVDRIYLPYDTPWAMRRFIAHFRPRFGLIMETELWPNLIAACHAYRVPLLLVNARLSERSAQRYARFAALTRVALQGLAHIAAQSTQDAERLKSLGAAAISLTGNIKFDLEPPAAQLALGQEFRSRIGKRQMWLAASTREGEEALILDAWRKVGGSDTATKSLLVIVPRHPQRFDEVVRHSTERGFTVQRRSDNSDILPQTDILIGDSMGEMFAWYAAADVAFIGGSLLDYGSQNLIEACAVGTPVLIGPSTRNFAEAAREAQACGAALPIHTAEELIQRVIELLADPEQCQQMRNAGLDFAQRHRGATEKTMALIRRTLAAR